MVRRAIERILANPRSETFNSLEITRVACARNVSSLVRYVTVSAQSRHIQESLFLSRAKSILAKTGKVSSKSRASKE